jgi:hypothetical protein
MRRTKTSILPSVDLMEPRLLLSTAAPFLSKHELTGVVREVKAIVHTLAKTGDTVQASTSLTELSSQLPSGPEELAPSWQSDINLYRPGSAKSIIVTERRILGDLYLYVQDGVDGGDSPVTGSGTTTSNNPGQGAVGSANPGQGTGGSAAPGQGTGGSVAPGQGTGNTSTPTPAPSLDSVSIQNTTGLALLVTVQLDVQQLQQPSITETIPAQGSSSVLFDFGTATGAFMTMDISLANGGQSPSPFTDVSLSQPLSGYNGALFTISLLGPYFNVTDD